MVKTLAREMDVMEEKLHGSIGTVRQSVRAIEKSQVERGGQCSY